MLYTVLWDTSQVVLVSLFKSLSFLSVVVPHLCFPHPFHKCVAQDLRRHVVVMSSTSVMACLGVLAYQQLKRWKENTITVTIVEMVHLPPAVAAAATSSSSPVPSPSLWENEKDMVGNVIQPALSFESRHQYGSSLTKTHKRRSRRRARHFLSPSFSSGDEDVEIERLSMTVDLMGSTNEGEKQKKAKKFESGWASRSHRTRSSSRQRGRAIAHKSNEEIIVPSHIFTSSSSFSDSTSSSSRSSSSSKSNKSCSGTTSDDASSEDSRDSSSSNSHRHHACHTLPMGGRGAAGYIERKNCLQFSSSFRGSGLSNRRAEKKERREAWENGSSTHLRKAFCTQVNLYTSSSPSLSSSYPFPDISGSGSAGGQRDGNTLGFMGTAGGGGERQGKEEERWRTSISSSDMEEVKVEGHILISTQMTQSARFMLKLLTTNLEWSSEEEEENQGECRRGEGGSGGEACARMYWDSRRTSPPPPLMCTGSESNNYNSENRIYALEGNKVGRLSSGIPDGFFPGSSSSASTLPTQWIQRTGKIQNFSPLNCDKVWRGEVRGAAVSGTPTNSTQNRKISYPSHPYRQFSFSSLLGLAPPHFRHRVVNPNELYGDLGNNLFSSISTTSSFSTTFTPASKDRGRLLSSSSFSSVSPPPLSIAPGETMMASSTTMSTPMRISDPVPPPSSSFSGALVVPVATSHRSSLPMIPTTANHLNPQYRSRDNLTTRSQPEPSVGPFTLLAASMGNSSSMFLGSRLGMNSGANPPFHHPYIYNTSSKTDSNNNNNYHHCDIVYPSVNGLSPSSSPNSSPSAFHVMEEEDGTPSYSHSSQPRGNTISDEGVGRVGRLGFMNSIPWTTSSSPPLSFISYDDRPPRQLTSAPPTALSMFPQQAPLPSAAPHRACHVREMSRRWRNGVRLRLFYLHHMVDRNDLERSQIFSFTPACVEEGVELFSYRATARYRNPPWTLWKVTTTTTHPTTSTIMTKKRRTSTAAAFPSCDCCSSSPNTGDNYRSGVVGPFFSLPVSPPLPSFSSSSVSFQRNGNLLPPAPLSSACGTPRDEVKSRRQHHFSSTSSSPSSISFSSLTPEAPREFYRHVIPSRVRLLHCPSRCRSISCSSPSPSSTSVSSFWRELWWRWTMLLPSPWWSSCSPRAVAQLLLSLPSLYTSLSQSLPNYSPSFFLSSSLSTNAARDPVRCIDFYIHFLEEVRNVKLFIRLPHRDLRMTSFDSEGVGRVHAPIKGKEHFLVWEVDNIASTTARKVKQYRQRKKDRLEKSKQQRKREQHETMERKHPKNKHHNEKHVMETTTYRRGLGEVLFGPRFSVFYRIFPLRRWIIYAGECGWKLFQLNHRRGGEPPLHAHKTTKKADKRYHYGAAHHLRTPAGRGRQKGKRYTHKKKRPQHSSFMLNEAKSSSSFSFSSSSLSSFSSDSDVDRPSHTSSSFASSCTTTPSSSRAASSASSFVNHTVRKYEKKARRTISSPMGEELLVLHVTLTYQPVPSSPFTLLGCPSDSSCSKSEEEEEEEMMILKEENRREEKKREMGMIINAVAQSPQTSFFIEGECERKEEMLPTQDIHSYRHNHNDHNYYHQKEMEGRDTLMNPAYSSLTPSPESVLTPFPTTSLPPMPFPSPQKEEERRNGNYEKAKEIFISESEGNKLQPSVTTEDREKKEEAKEKKKNKMRGKNGTMMEESRGTAFSTSATPRSTSSRSTGTSASASSVTPSSLSFLMAASRNVSRVLSTFVSEPSRAILPWTPFRSQHSPSSPPPPSMVNTSNSPCAIFSKGNASSDGTLETPVGRVSPPPSALVKENENTCSSQSPHDNSSANPFSSCTPTTTTKTTVIENSVQDINVPRDGAPYFLSSSAMASSSHLASSSSQEEKITVHNEAASMPTQRPREIVQQRGPPTVSTSRRSLPLSHTHPRFPTMHLTYQVSGVASGIGVRRLQVSNERPNWEPSTAWDRHFWYPLFFQWLCPLPLLKLQKKMMWVTQPVVFSEETI